MIHRTRATSAAVHPSGWARLPSGKEVTRLPLVDTAHRLPAGEQLFARLTYADALIVAEREGARLISPEALLELGNVGLQLRPFTGTPIAETDLVHSERHDADVQRQLDALDWDALRPVSGAGKHWVAGPDDAYSHLMGWDVDGPGPGKRLWQPLAKAHRGRAHHDDGTTTMLERGPASAPADIHSLENIAPDWRAGWSVAGWDLATLPLGMRCLAYVGFQLGLAISEIPGAKHNPQILSYSKHCRRGGRFRGVDAQQLSLWDGGSPLALQTDDGGDPWCAALASETLRCALLPGEAPPHGLRVSVRELVEDARSAGTLRPADWLPTLGALMIEARAGEDPLKGGRGHVRRVVQVDGERVSAIGGNEQDRIQWQWHPLRKPELRAWIDVDAKPPPKGEQLPAEKTPATPAEIAAALQAAWPEGSHAARVALLAQILHETAEGKALRAHNVGNARAKPNGQHCWTFFQTYEFLSPKQALAYVKTARPRTDGVVGLDAEFSGTQRPDGSQRVNFYPSSIGACFRAFRALADGVADHIAMLRSEFPESWKAAAAGEVAGFAHALHAEGYFTQQPDKYEAALARLAAKYAALSH